MSLLMFRNKKVSYLRNIRVHAQKVLSAFLGLSLSSILRNLSRRTNRKLKFFVIAFVKVHNTLKNVTETVAEEIPELIIIILVTVTPLS